MGTCLTALLMGYLRADARRPSPGVSPHPTLVEEELQACLEPQSSLATVDGMEMGHHSSFLGIQN